MKIEITAKDKTVQAFNIGTNAGKISGQSIMHCHIHIIPRREGDVESPQGCLLYTSPSPRDKRQSRMPSSA